MLTISNTDLYKMIDFVRNMQPALICDFSPIGWKVEQRRQDRIDTPTNYINIWRNLQNLYIS